ncbi:hypothetical protein BS47DRAFT_1370060 [Hydnum rufescens UP504]|uniref:Uncharacterized protein n=1 Tax=Hydnum rufescens UP504 TaxID=1448309 RepID=A0A9P6AAB0_9AGAM|nr:hypothetical protein BS47DRAFT_1370060 [Hydnum rufescens UP504]
MYDIWWYSRVVSRDDPGMDNIWWYTRSSRETTQENQIAGWENAQTNKDRDMKAYVIDTAHWRNEGLESKEREGTPKIFEGVEKYTFAASIAAIDREDRDQIQDFALNRVMKGMMVVSEGWKFGMWNQHGVETMHATNLAERRVHDDLEEMMTEADKSEGKAQLEELTKTIGWLKGEMKWNHLWHLNVWDLDQLRSMSYPEDIIFAHLSRNTNKYVYLETESERVLLDIQEVLECVETGRRYLGVADSEHRGHQGPGAVYAANELCTGTEGVRKRQTQVKGRQNSTTNSFIYSQYAVRMMCRYAHCGSHYFNGHYRSLKGMRVLLEGHLSGVGVGSRLEYLQN